MRNLSLVSIAVLFLLAGCAPAATSAPTSAPIPTATTAVIVENPPECAAANMIYHSQLQEVLLIGCAPGSARQDGPNIIWGWNGERWRRVTEGDPPMRILGGAAYDEKRNVVVLYGGYSWEKNTCEHETWEWDGETWAKKAAEGPTACDHLEMVYEASSGRLILTGGGDENQNLREETWSWDGEQWTSVSGDGPPGRAHFGFVYDGVHEQALLYGGYADQILDDFWVWKADAWQPIDFPGPGPLSHFGMASDKAANELVIFGGASSTSTFSSLSDKTWRLANGAWSEQSLEEHPSKRGSPAMVYDPERQRIVLYGGFSPSRIDLGDTWEWDGNQWQCRMNCPK